MTTTIYLSCNTQDEDWYKNPNQLQLYIYLLIHANREPTCEKRIHIDSGQIRTTRSKLMQELKMSESKLRNALDKLCADGKISIRTTSRYTLITISNFAHIVTPNNHFAHAPKLGVGEWTKNDKRYYGTTAKPIEVPPDMPPRPSAQHAMDKAGKRWLIL